MNVRSILENGERATAVPQYVLPDQSEKIVETIKSCLQTSLVGESQNFRSSVAAAQRKFNRAQQMALLTTAAACLVSSLVVFAGFRQAHQMVSQGETQLQHAQTEAVGAPDAFVSLRQQNWEPIGKLITQQGRTFIELKAAK